MVKGTATIKIKISSSTSASENTTHKQHVIQSQFLFCRHRPGPKENPKNMFQSKKKRSFTPTIFSAPVTSQRACPHNMRASYINDEMKWEKTLDARGATIKHVTIVIASLT